ncbi:MAG TPA: endopeptidase, partial [Acidobacteriota bacterium]|nr:endopeptidase [Acidobacteriota bacterium]
MRLSSSTMIAIVVILLCTLSASLTALQPDKPQTQFQTRQFFNPELYISSSNVELPSLLLQMPNQQEWDNWYKRYGNDFHIYVDPRTGTPTNILGHIPMIPGNGVGNTLTLQDVSLRLGRQVQAADTEIVGDLIRQFIQENQKTFNIDAAQMGQIRTAQVTEDLWQISIPQQINGIPVRYGRIVATISHGNLLLFGTETWSNVQMDTVARISPQRALEIGFAYAGGRQPHDRLWKEPVLEVIPYAPAEFQAGEGFAGPIGKGISHRLVWTFGFMRDPDPGRWETIVDAQNEELLAFQDTNQYVSQKIVGAVYPLTSTEVC